MISNTVVGKRVDQDVQILAVKHEPGNECREIFHREGHLIHRDRMRPDWLIMPVSDPSTRKTLADRRPQLLGDAPGTRSIIKVRVITLDYGRIGEPPNHAHLLL